MFSSLPLRKQLNPGLLIIVAFRGVSTHGLPSFLLHAVDVDLKVARFLLSLIPAEDVLELVLGHELAEVRHEQGGTGRVAHCYVRLGRG